jgi:hypothetical protein
MIQETLRSMRREYRHRQNLRLARKAADRELAQVSQHPLTFTEKLRYKMAYDRRPLLTTLADKVAVRDFVKSRVGAEYLPTAFGIHRHASEIVWANVPREFAIKASHGSGAAVVVWEGAPQTRLLPDVGCPPSWDRHLIHPDYLSFDALASLADGWMGLRYQYGHQRLPEWCYRDIPPRVLIEELLLDLDGRLPLDYKFLMFDGDCGVILLQAGYPVWTRDYYSPDWQWLPVSRGKAHADLRPPRPKNLALMLDIASRLSRGVDFVRVDLYDLGNRVVFGEMTNYPGAAQEPYSPWSFDLQLGELWNLPPAVQ